MPIKRAETTSKLDLACAELLNSYRKEVCLQSLNSRFANFIKSIRPSDAQLDAARSELDFLEEKLGSFIQDGDKFKFVKALRSGSYAKNTILKRHDEGDFDADLGIYIESEDGSEISSFEALSYIESILQRAYANRKSRKPKYDRSKKSSIKVMFTDHPKINLDVVSIESKSHAKIENWGEIIRRDGTRKETSVSEHIEFVRTRNKVVESTPYNQLVRIWKWWRNHAFTQEEQDKFSSFFMETYLGKAFDETSATFGSSWSKNLLTLANWILRDRLRAKIIFEDDRVAEPEEYPDDTVVVLDPLNKSNNITHDWSDCDRELFLSKLQEFSSVLTDVDIADDQNDLDDEIESLDQVLPSFSSWSEE